VVVTAFETDMSDEAALLAAIQAHPDEDTPRLMYADWLDEHGQPERAEFIRLQCAPDAGEAAEDRATELEERNGAKWLAGLPQLPAGAHWGFRRGFPEYLDIDAELFLDSYAAFARARWLRFLSLYRLNNSLVRDFLNRSWNPRWVELDLEEDGDLAERGDYDGTPGIVALANSPQVARLHRLQLSMFTLSRDAEPALIALRGHFGHRFSNF
jgi:uncharacterized protein (TIGR02996 family)